MVWPGMNQVDLISHRASISSRRSVATAPNSPREIALGEVAFRLPSRHTQIASKSNDRHTETLARPWIVPPNLDRRAQIR